MSWRTVVVTGCAKLDYKMGYLVVRKAAQTNKIHISEIGVLIVESTAVSLTSMLLCELIKRKVKVIFCDEKHNPISELLAYYGSHDTSMKIKQQISWLKSDKDFTWAEIVREKIRKQSNHLYQRGHTQAADLLLQYVREVEPADKTNREGHAAKVYFNALFGLDFTRTLDCPINATLNYGYGILLSYFTREITANGYITQLGIFHDNMFNPFNLASDLMEPFRILIDKKVYALQPEKFDHEEKIQILSVFNQEVWIDGKKQYVSNAIKIYCRSIFESLNEGDISSIRFYSDEL